MSSPGPREVLRSAAFLSTQAAEPMSRSPGSAISIHSASSGGHPPPSLRRRSTDTSGGLDYYWSSVAGAGPGSSTSSLVISPSPSITALSLPAPTLDPPRPGHGRMRSKSSINLRDPPKADAPLVPPIQAPNPHVQTGASATSPGGWSDTSEYSNRDSGGPFPARPGPVRADTLDTYYAAYSSSPVRNASSDGRGDWEKRRAEPRESVSTVRAPPDEDSVHRTPTAPSYSDGDDLKTPQLAYDVAQFVRHSSPSTSSVAQTPTHGTHGTGASPSASNYTPGSGRQRFYPSPSSAGSQSPNLSTPNKSPGPPRSPVPRSAPPTKTEFGVGPPIQRDDTEDGLKRSNRTTLPNPMSTSSSERSTDGLLSPEKDKTTQSRESSPGKSPEPPPRSSLRNNFNQSGSMDHLTPKKATSPLNLSPRVGPLALPTIINTPHSPDPSPPKPPPSRPSRSPSRASSDNASGTISELTDLLGGAINEIQRANSKDATPLDVSRVHSPARSEALSLPPGAASPDRLEPLFDRSMTLSSTESIKAPPSFIPSRSGSLFDEPVSDSMPPPPVPPLHQIRRPNSSLSLRQQSLYTSPTSPSGPKPWPPAMLYGSIKAIKYPGDRAKAYARSINDLARADSGLRDWCLAAASQSRPTVMPPRASRAGLGLRTPSYSSTLLAPSVHGRNVSAGSEFPMRADSYSAREISQRMMDPSDQPTTLPPNLPYPQLQQIASGGGMKTSQSMQSVASTASKKGGFFSNIGKKSSKKESISLGPPSSIAKKDVRGLPISSPSSFRTTSPQKPDEGRSVGPTGPRGPRSSFTPPPPIRDAESGPVRSSLDTGMARIGNAVPRGSLDGHVGQLKTGPSLPPRSSPMAQQGWSAREGSPVKDEDLKSMSEVLPHADRGVLRVYLSRHGDQMRAIGAYIEDEQRGQVLRP